MFKTMFGPVQAWLLSQGKCVGCGATLPKKEGTGLIQTTCACGRIYMYDSVGRRFRRAGFHEIK
jgi:hypothetical protein